VAGVVTFAALTRSPTSGSIVGYRASTLLLGRQLAVAGYAVRLAGALAAIGVTRRIDEAQAARVDQGILLPPRPDTPRPDAALS
jgi:hypothetical protein